MATAPYGVRLLLGAAVTAIEETRKLPQTILTYPMTIVSQIAHLVMKVQQDVADLVNRGDETLESLFPPKDEQPEWATFDEDLTDVLPEPAAPDGERLTEGRFALFTGGEPDTRVDDDGADSGDRPARRGQAPGLRDADAGPVAGPADVAACRRSGRTAGLRGRDQVARTVPDSAGQQDHPRDRQVTEAEQGKSPENPWPVRAVATRVAKYIDRLGMVWVEGQLTELKLRQSTAWMVLRDPAADMSLSVSCPRDLVASAPVPLSEGTQVIMLGKPQFYTRNGSFSLRVSEIRAVGVGELLARIERLRKLLDAEGLFDPRLKRPIPFLPNTIGLITGRASAAERDVMTVATGRWPAVRFAVRNTVVQGPNAVPQIVEALRELDGDPAVDVIVVARGGGSVEDLLPFSDETLCRAISACTTPVVSAVGHEPDNPLCDLVADLRAATPTDAAKRIVPDTAAEQALLLDLRRRSARALRNWVHREQHVVSQLRSRPVLAQPLAALTMRADEIQRARTAARRDVTRLVATESERVGHLSARLTTLGPAATLARGYAVVQTVPVAGEAAVLHTVADAPAGTRLRIRVSDGAVTAVSEGSQ